MATATALGVDQERSTARTTNPAHGPMCVAELVALCSEVESQGLSVLILAAQRLRHGRRIPEPRRVAGSLRTQPVGGNELNWFVAVEVKDARAFAKRRSPETVIPLRVVRGPEKMSAQMRRMCGADDPPADPWGNSRRAK